MDIVTQLQDEVGQMCTHMYNFTGVIQRDAQPVSVAGEPLQEPQTPAPPEVDVDGMAREMMKTAKAVDELVHALPPVTQSERESVALLRRLMEENEQAAREVAESMKKAERQLAEHQKLFKVLAEEEELRRVLQLGGAVGGGGGSTSVPGVPGQGREGAGAGR